MKLNAKNMLKSQEILRLVVFFAVTVLLGFSTVGNVEALIVFVVSGLLGSFYSKNMIVVLGVAILLTLIWYFVSLGYYREGATGRKHKKKHSNKKKPGNKNMKKNNASNNDNTNNDNTNKNISKVENILDKFEGLVNRVHSLRKDLG